MDEMSSGICGLDEQAIESMGYLTRRKGLPYYFHAARKAVRESPSARAGELQSSHASPCLPAGPASRAFHFPFRHPIEAQLAAPEGRRKCPPAGGLTSRRPRQVELAGRVQFVESRGDQIPASRSAEVAASRETPAIRTMPGSEAKQPSILLQGSCSIA